MSALISIIIPVYNGERTLDKCISSVMSQSFSDYEILLVDDGSTDGSYELMSSYGDERIRVFHKENGGVSSARNLGIENATGEYLLFLDCDDALGEGALENYASTVEGSAPDVVSTAIAVRVRGEKTSVIGFENDMILEDDVFSYLLRSPEKFGYAGGKLIKRSTVTDNGLKFDTKMKTQEDLSFLIDVYDLGSRFAVSSFEGYIYELQHEERPISAADNVKNRIKAILCAEKHEMTDPEALKTASDKLLQTVYSYLCYAGGREARELISELGALTGIGEAIAYRSDDTRLNAVAKALTTGKASGLLAELSVRRAVRGIINKFK